MLEITESQLLEDAEHSVAALHALRELGVRLALDDFGTGYSSLSYLHSLPLDILKIAKPFVDRVAEASQDSFVRMMIDLAKALELEVIAEGIETAEQVEALRVLQSSFGQGFFLARPEAATSSPDVALGVEHSYVGPAGLRRPRAAADTAPNEGAVQGKPVARRGRKARGLARDARRPSRQLDHRALAAARRPPE